MYLTEKIKKCCDVLATNKNEPTDEVYSKLLVTEFKNNWLNHHLCDYCRSSIVNEIERQEKEHIQLQIFTPEEQLKISNKLVEELKERNRIKKIIYKDNPTIILPFDLFSNMYVRYIYYDNDVYKLWYTCNDAKVGLRDVRLYELDFDDLVCSKIDIV